ncbi:MAG: class I SAM-dependent methyltransferase [Parachlamydiales bacterium]|nr:class I SAM-dependent methyltransferase [Parachlamydiales bacterium]
MKKQTFHLQKAHSYWKLFLKPDDIAIDATCGNGHDSLVLKNILKAGILYGFDIQKSAIENTEKLLKENLSSEDFQNIFLHESSHEDFSKYIKNKVNLVTYNLGYLPGFSKSVTTKVDSTLKSINSALSILNNKGAISIISYPGHEEGEKEEIALLQFLKTLDRKAFSVCYHKWLNKEKAPSFFWIEKLLF